MKLSAPPMPTAPASLSPRAAPRGTDLRTILLCEDDQGDTEIFRFALGAAKIRNAVHHTGDGEETLEFLRKAADSATGEPPIPSLVFLDLKMPFVNGFEVLEWMRQRREFDYTCVVVLSSSAEHQDVDRAYAAGANGYLAKPPRPGDLLAALNLVAHNNAPWIGLRLGAFGVGR
jgi:CheY-like chemotaxis protein